MPKVSVIVPNYNHGKYLPRRLDSILGQTFRDFEVIVLDDASTDGSLAVIEPYAKDPRITAVICSESNGGSAFRQWRKGFGAASGELIWIAESDDFCSPLFLETMVAEFDSDPRCVLSFCASMLTSEDGAPLHIHRYQKKIGRDLHMDGKAFVRRWLIRSNCVVNASGALFRKSALSGVGDDFVSFRGVGDWLFWTGISLQGNVCFRYAPLNFFRQHGGNTTEALRRSGEDLLELRRLLTEFEKMGLRRPLLWLRYRVYAVHAARYDRSFPEELRLKVLEAWHDTPAVTFLARIKEHI